MIGNVKEINNNKNNKNNNISISINLISQNILTSFYKRGGN